ncbi:hypothetical protein CLOM_g5283 [Closterium sp. NIES-68]|nr:hypothetical protein CLOM_g18405 [Closterium sp. NIES-68]GJP45946.1 hypothetical protein CLOM_g5283 [Closterium sp. NIES-68]
MLLAHSDEPTETSLLRASFAKLQPEAMGVSNLWVAKERKLWDSTLRTKLAKARSYEPQRSEQASVAKQLACKLI